LALLLGIGGALFGIFGCGREPQERNDIPSTEAATDTDRPSMTQLSPPHSGWISYSPKDRKLTFYELPGSGRWMVKRSDQAAAYPVGPEHTLPEGLDPKEMVVFYVRPGGLTSRSVTLAQIQSARPEHVSLLR
jgi:hypothetical protein